MLHGGTLWNVSYGFPRGVKLLCFGFVLFFTSFILFSLFYSLNVNITVWGHWIVRVFFLFLFSRHTSILCLCIQYTVDPHFSRQF